MRLCEPRKTVLSVFIFCILYVAVCGYPLHSPDIFDNDAPLHRGYFNFWTRNPREGAQWSYEDTGAWKDVAATCGGLNQSPINIEPRDSTLKSYSKFTFTNYGNVDKITLTNNGHTAVFTVPTTLPSDRVPYITEGGLGDKYILAQFHFHWGKDSSRGSEHTIRNKQYAAELHMVHYNAKYGTLANAVTHSDGLAVLGILIRVGGNNENEFFKPLVDQLHEVTTEGAEVTLSNLVSLKDLLPRRTTSFYRYKGSLTTPNCNEIVTWTVFDEPITVTENQIDKFRKLLDLKNKNLVDNFRPPMPLNGRIVTYRPYHGCEIPKEWPMSSNAIASAIVFKNCVISYHTKALFSFFGIGSPP